MTKPKRANDLNNIPCWKISVCMRGGAILHLLSRIEPVVTHANGEVKDVLIECITETEHGDTVGFILGLKPYRNGKNERADWLEVGAITWRFAPLATE